MRAVIIGTGLMEGMMGKTKDSAIIGSRVLSRNEVLKVLPTFDNLFYQIEDLRSQIRDIEELDNSIVDKDGVVWEIVQKNNAFAILGKRGTGKTSIMYTIKERLEREQSQDIFLPLLIPDNMADNSDIMGAVLGMFHEVIKKQTEQIQSQHHKKKFDEFYDSNTCIYKKQNKLGLAYDNMCKVYCYLKPEYKQIISKGYTDLGSYITKSSEILSADSQFKSVFDQFIYQLVKTQMKLYSETERENKIPLIHIFLDDIDLNPERSGEIAKILLAYLAHPAIIVHISGDIDTFEEALTLSFLKTQDGMIEKELLDQEIVAGQKLLVRKQELAYEYLKKIIPPVYRQHLSYWPLKMRGLYAISESHNEGTVQEITLMDLLLKLLGDQAGGLFSSYVRATGKHEVFPLGYHIFDETSRGLNNVYLFLMQEYKRREFGNEEKAEVKSYKEYEFKKKFFDILINANPRLNKNRAMIEGIISWGERESLTLIRLDNFTYVVEQFFSDMRLDKNAGWKEVDLIGRPIKNDRVKGENKNSDADRNVKYKNQKPDETALEYFAVFELIYLACRVLMDAEYDEKELDSAKIKALELLWDYPIITESPVKIGGESWVHSLIDLYSSEPAPKTAEEQKEEMEFVDLSWCLINLYARNNFEIAIHYFQEIIHEVGYQISEQDFSQVKFLSCFAKVLSQFQNISILKQWCENNVSVLNHIFKNTTLSADNIILNNLLDSIVINKKSFKTIPILAQNKWEYPRSKETGILKFTEEGICHLISRLIKNSIQEKNAIQLDKPEEVKRIIESRLEEESFYINKLLEEARAEEKYIIGKGEIKNLKDKINNLLNLKLLMAVIKKDLTDQRWAVQLIDSNISLINREIINSFKENSVSNENNLNENFIMENRSIQKISVGYDEFMDKLKGVGTNTIAYKTVFQLENFTNTQRQIKLNDYLEIYVLVSQLASNYRVLYGRREAQEFLKIIDNAGLRIDALEEGHSQLMVRILCYLSYSITMDKNIDDLFESAKLINELNQDIMDTEREYDLEIMNEIKQLLELSDDDVSSISDISEILEA